LYFRRKAGEKRGEGKKKEIAASSEKELPVNFHRTLFQYAPARERRMKKEGREGKRKEKGGQANLTFPSRFLDIHD